MLFDCLTASLTENTMTKFMQNLKAYMLKYMLYGCLLKIIIAMSQINSKATVIFLRDQLGALHMYMLQLRHIVT